MREKESTLRKKKIKMTLEELFKYKFGFGKNEFVDVVDIRTQKISD